MLAQARNPHGLLLQILNVTGFGEGIAKVYAFEGANVTIANISSARGQRVEAEMNSTSSTSSNHGNATFIAMDVVS